MTMFSRLCIVFRKSLQLVETKFNKFKPSPIDIASVVECIIFRHRHRRRRRRQNHRRRRSRSPVEVIEEN